MSKKLIRFDWAMKKMLRHKVYFLKNSEVKDNFKAKGLDKAKEKWLFIKESG
jgi:hypothetical protein